MSKQLTKKIAPCRFFHKFNAHRNEFFEKFPFKNKIKCSIGQSFSYFNRQIITYPLLLLSFSGLRDFRFDCVQGKGRSAEKIEFKLKRFQIGLLITIYALTNNFVYVKTEMCIFYFFFIFIDLISIKSVLIRKKVLNI